MSPGASLYEVYCGCFGGPEANDPWDSLPPDVQENWETFASVIEECKDVS